MATETHQMKPLLQKIEAKADQLKQERGSLYSLGFHAYMFWVFYKRNDEKQALQGSASVTYASSMPEERADIIEGRVQSDFVDGFNYAKVYAVEYAKELV